MSGQLQCKQTGKRSKPKCVIEISDPSQIWLASTQFSLGQSRSEVFSLPMSIDMSCRLRGMASACNAQRCCLRAYESTCLELRLRC